MLELAPCSFREDPASGNTEPAHPVCGLIKVLTGVQDDKLCIVDPSACRACSRSAPPSQFRINPVIASLVYRAASTIIEQGIYRGCDVEHAQRLKAYATRNLAFMGRNGRNRECYQNFSNERLEADVRELSGRSCSSGDVPHSGQVDYPIPIGVTRWAVGVTTAPRPEPTIARCMASIEAAGFDDIVVFAEPGSHTETSWNVVERPETIASPRWNLEKIEPLGVWRNYVQSLADLLVGFPDAEAIVLFQDDTVCCRGMRRLLEHELWPAHDAFVVSPYCPDSADFDLGGVDWTPFSSGRRPITDLIGACCFVYPRESAQMIVDHALSKTWRGHPRWRTRDLSKVKNLDGFIGAVVDALNTNFNVRRRGWKYRVYYANPSLVETIDRGGNSSLGHNDWKQNRGASRFVGEKTDAKNIFASCNPWYSVNLPDRTMSRNHRNSRLVSIRSASCLSLRTV